MISLEREKGRKRMEGEKEKERTNAIAALVRMFYGSRQSLHWMHHMMRRHSLQWIYYMMVWNVWSDCMIL